MSSRSNDIEKSMENRKIVVVIEETGFYEQKSYRYQVQVVEESQTNCK